MALFFVMFNDATNITSEFTQSFLRSSSRSGDNCKDSCFDIVNTHDIHNNTNHTLGMIIKSLTRRQIAEYIPITFIYGNHRLAINDTSADGMQPFEYPWVFSQKQQMSIIANGTNKLLGNGEIYNYTDLVNSYGISNELQSECDMEIPLYIYSKNTNKIPVERMKDIVKKLDGEYVLIIVENSQTIFLENQSIFVARDALGLKSAYSVIRRTGNKYFCMVVSELKEIPKSVINGNVRISQLIRNSILSLPDGNNIISQEDVVNRYIDISNCKYNIPNSETLEICYKLFRETIISAVRKRIVSDCCVGVFVSGDFNSSLLLGILLSEYSYVGYSLENIVLFTTDTGCVNNTKYCIEYFQKKYDITFRHYTVNISDIDVITNEIPNIISITETCNPECIYRTLVPYFLCKFIKNSNLNVKVIYTGEHFGLVYGSDFYNSSNLQEIQTKTCDAIDSASKDVFPLLDKVYTNFGMEVRYPYTDTSFVDLVLSINPLLRKPQIYNTNISPIPSDKYIIRKAFSLSECEYIDEILLWSLIEKSQNTISSVSDIRIKYNSTVDNNTSALLQQFYTKFKNNLLVNASISIKSCEDVFDLFCFKTLCDSLNIC